MKEEKLKIEGMTCMHCVMRVKKALDALKGVQDSDVQVNEARVKYDESKLGRADLEAAVVKAGYKVKG
jgi:copper chaperone